MATYNKTQQLFNEMDYRKMVVCIWNKNHNVSHGKYQAHQLKCPDRPRIVHKCQYNFLHEFRTEKEKNSHELNCEGLHRRIREEQEKAEYERKHGPRAPVILAEPLAAGESTDPWADEGAQEGVKTFRAPGLGLTPQQIEDFIQNYTGDEPVCEYMLVAMTPSQKQMVRNKQMVRTQDRAAQAKKETRTQAIASEPVVRAPRNAVISSIMHQSASQDTEDGSVEEMDTSDQPSISSPAGGNSTARDPADPWGSKRNAQGASITNGPGVKLPTGGDFNNLTGIGRGKPRPPPSSFA